MTSVTGEDMDYPYTQQAPAAGAPADVVRRVFAALDARRWAEVLALTDPAALERFAAEQVAELRELEARRSVADALGERSALSPESRQRLARGEEESRVAQRARFAEAYGGRDTSEQLARLAPRELFLRWLAYSDPAEYVRRSVAHLESTRPEAANAASSLALSFRREIVSTEYDGTDRARVEYREWMVLQGADEDEEAVVRTAELRRVDGEWRMEVDAELMGHASLLVVVEE